MSSLYKIFFKNIKKEPSKIFIYSFNETLNGIVIKKELIFKKIY